MLKRLNCPKLFFSLKTNKILKKFLEPIQSYENVPFSGPFHCAKFKKILTADAES